MQSKHRRVVDSATVVRKLVRCFLIGMHDAGFLPVSDMPIFSSSFWQTSDADAHTFPTKTIKFLLWSNQQITHSYGESPLQTKLSLCDTGAFFSTKHFSTFVFFHSLSLIQIRFLNNKTTALLSLTQHHNNTESCPYLISSLLNHRHTHTHTHTQMQTYNLSPHSSLQAV